MKILEIAPPWIKPWPPLSYGAIERVVWELGEAMRSLGAEVDYAVEDEEIRRAATVQYDFVHCHTPPQGALLRNLGVPYVATAHWSQHWNDTPEGAESREFVDLAEAHLALCDRVYSGRKCAVIGQGVNMDEFPTRKGKSAKNENKLLMVGTYQFAHTSTTNPVERKRYRHGIKTLALIPEATLTIVGPGVDQMIWDICKDEGVNQERVTLTGNLERAALVELMQQSTALIHAATQEVVALVPLEAMAAGLPVICARPSNEYGVSVTVYDHWEHIPSALEDIKSNYTRVVNRGLKYAKSCSWQQIAENTLPILEEWLDESERIIL